MSNKYAEIKTQIDKLVDEIDKAKELYADDSIIDTFHKMLEISNHVADTICNLEMVTGLR